MISALEILKEVHSNPNAALFKPMRVPRSDSDGFCKRHPRVRKNPLSRSYCDECLDYWRDKKRPANRPLMSLGRKTIPRGGARHES